MIICSFETCHLTSTVTGCLDITIFSIFFMSCNSITMHGASLMRHFASGSHKHHHQENSQPDEPQNGEPNPSASQPDDVEFVPTDESLQDILSNKGIPSEPSANPNRGQTLAVAPTFKTSLSVLRCRNVSLIVAVCAKRLISWIRFCCSNALKCSWIPLDFLI